ncbi:cell filamentation protein Fic [Campylobacter jejuni]|nr:cell filamentation protein Fic [Campylobacter jejuni]
MRNLTLEENIFLAKRNLVDIIWKSANLEGVNVTFPETQMIIDGFSVADKTIQDLTIILNLKRAWQYLFDTINQKVNLNLIQDFNRIVGRDLVYKSGFLRTADIKISGTDFKPKLPIDYEVNTNIETILKNENKQDVALDLMLYLMRNQLFFDGNKRTSMLIANKILIENGFGVLAVAKKNMSEFFTHLVKFYETNNSSEIKQFCKENCIETMIFSQNENKTEKEINYRKNR